jgi:predicted RNA-binding Zn-ribbon protein involved in translation (DUF1610 family)
MEEKEFEENKHIKFKCPSCGVVERDEVIFLCNKCEQADMVYKEGVYMCPSCLVPGENFECMRCGSKEVKMKIKE